MKTKKIPEYLNVGDCFYVVDKQNKNIISLPIISIFDCGDIYYTISDELFVSRNSFLNEYGLDTYPGVYADLQEAEEALKGE